MKPETEKTMTLDPERARQLAMLCKLYKQEQTEETVHKNNKNAVGQKIKEMLGDKFDGEIVLKTDDFTGKVVYKIVISFTADKEKIVKDGLFDEYYTASQSHPLKLF